MRIICAVLLLLAACDFLDPCSGPEYLNFAIVRHGMLSGGSPTLSSTAPRWGETESMTPMDEISLVFPQDDVLPPDALELYAPDGTRVTLASEDIFVPTNGEGCAHDERWYSLASLALGDYTLVHRQRNGTGDPLNCAEPDCPWTTFDGDQAVTLTLSIR
jgi:hypothetical protein